MKESQADLLTHVAKLGISDEFTDHTLYERMSRSVSKDSEFAKTLGDLSTTELGHFEFWRKYAPEAEARPSMVKVYWVLFLRYVLGLTFAVRYLERHEATVIKAYKSVSHLIPAEDKAKFDKVISDEETHEREFSRRIESSAVRYISFVVLGLADALVEITGIHAGSLGIYEQTEIAGLAGIIAGAAASLAMASAAFAQAKQGFQGSAKLSAAYTGISYFITAIVLATPYFLTRSMTLAISVSLALAVLLLTIITFYSSVISSKPFTRDFLEILLIMFGVTVALYLFGYFIRVATGITI
jgi:VIT1/CCC1 family predicted Fe2+/Mn2+ transporter